MNFLLLILLDISASDDDSPCISVARRPLEALMADWLRQREEINLLRDRVAGQSRPVPRGANPFRRREFRKPNSSTLACPPSPDRLSFQRTILMKPSHLVEALITAVPQNVPLHIWGACGVGKSQLVKQVAQHLKREFIDVRAVQLDPVDFRGLPRIKDDRTEWITPNFLPTSGRGHSLPR